MTNSRQETEKMLKHDAMNHNMSTVSVTSSDQQPLPYINNK